MKKLLFSAIAIYLLSSCESDNPKLNDYDIWLPDALKKDCYFLPGSYWVYHEPGTGYFDSIWVVSAKLDTLPILHKGKRDTLGFKEYFEVTYQSIFFGSRFKHFSEVEDNCVWFGSGDATCYWVIRGNLDNQAKITASTRIIGYPTQLGDVHPTRVGGSSDNQIRFDSSFANYAMDTLNFPFVKMMHINIDPTQQNTEVHRYFGKSIGVVRRHLPLGNIDWRLIRYRAVQQKAHH